MLYYIMLFYINYMILYYITIILYIIIYIYNYLSIWAHMYLQKCVCVHVQTYSDGITQPPLWTVVEGPCELLVSPLEVVIKDLAAAMPIQVKGRLLVRRSKAE